MANWKKAVGWTAVAIGALLMVAIVGAFFVLRSQSFHEWAIRKIQQEASQSTGARVELQNFDVELKTLTAHVYGLTIHGTEAAGQKPLLQIKSATVGIKIISILHHTVNLSELIVDGPVVNLSVSQDGRSNLPTPPPSNSQSSTNVFDLAVGHVLLTHGELFVRDRQLPIDANLFGLRTEIGFSQLQKKYTGSIRYDNGKIYYGAPAPLPHSLDASFSATPSELTLSPLLLNLGGSHARVEAEVRNYGSAPVANGRYEIFVHTQDFAGLSSAKTAGDVELAGTMEYHDVANQPALRNATLKGNVSSNGLALRTDQATLRIEKISGGYQLANGNFNVKNFALNLLNGTVRADGTMKHLDSTPQAQFHVAASGISLHAIKAALRSYSNQSVPVTGTINALADASWSGPMASAMKNFRASSSVTMRGALVAANASRSQSFPLNADVRLNYDGRNNVISIPQGNIQLPATTITAQGEVGDHSNLAIKAVSNNLHQLMMLATSFQPPAPNGSSAGSSLPNLQGEATLNANVQGTLNQPRITAQLSASKLQVNQGQFSSLQLSLAANPAEVVIQNGSLSALPRGTLHFSGRASLQEWAYSPSQAVAASLQIRQMPLAMLDQIATTSYPITGDLNGDAQLKGSELNPSGDGKLQVSKARVQDEPLDNLVLQFTASNGTIRSELTEAQNKLQLNYTPKTKSYEVKLDAPPQEVSKLHAVQARNMPLKGKLGITASGAGTIDNPSLNASIQMHDLQIRETTVSEVRLDLNIANHAAKFALTSNGGPANLQGNGTVQLSPGYYTEASVNTSRFPLDPLLALYMPSRPNGLSAETELHASIRGPLADQSKLEAHLTIPVFEAKYQQLQFANDGPIAVDYANSVVTLKPSAFKGTGSSLQLQGRVPLASAAKMDVSAKGSLDLRLAQMLDPDVQTAGSIALDVNAGGTISNPGMSGQIKIQNASFATETVPVGIDSLNAVMQVSDTGVQITKASGKIGGGELTFGGSVLYRPQLQANLTLSGKSIRLRYPEGMRTIFDSELALTGTAKSSVLQGRVLVDSLSFTSDFDMTSFMSQFSGPTVPSTGQSFADTVKLQVQVQSSSQLSAGTSQLGIEGDANLRVIGTAANPVIVGRTDITSGDLFFEKQQYHLEQGVINFINPNQTDPVLNLQITTTIQQYNITIRLTGPMEKLQISYVSDPPLAPTDIIKLVAFGSTPGAPESFGANTVLAQGLSQVESTVGGSISKLTGVAGLQIDPLIGGNNTNPSARIGLQKRVTKNFLFTFSTDVTQPQDEIVQGEYQLNKRWSVSVVRDESGGVGIDGRFHTNF